MRSGWALGLALLAGVLQGCESEPKKAATPAVQPSLTGTNSGPLLAKPAEAVETSDDGFSKVTDLQAVCTGTGGEIPAGECFIPKGAEVAPDGTVTVGAISAYLEFMIGQGYGDACFDCTVRGCDGGKMGDLNVIYAKVDPKAVPPGPRTEDLGKLSSSQPPNGCPNIPPAEPQLEQYKLPAACILVAMLQSSVIEEATTPIRHQKLCNYAHKTQAVADPDSFYNAFRVSPLVKGVGLFTRPAWSISSKKVSEVLEKSLPKAPTTASSLEVPPAANATARPPKAATLHAHLAQLGLLETHRTSVLHEHLAAMPGHEELSEALERGPAPRVEARRSGPFVSQVSPTGDIIPQPAAGS